MKKIFTNNNCRHSCLFLTIILLLSFIAKLRAQDFPFYSKSNTDTVVSKSETLSENEIVLLSVPERFKSHPEYGKTKLANPDMQDSYELIHERTIDSRLFQNLDGSFTTVKSGEPMHYKDKDNWWRTIDVTFEKDPQNPDVYHLNKQPLPIAFDAKTAHINMQVDEMNNGLQYGNELSLIQLNQHEQILSKQNINNIMANVDASNAQAYINNIFNGIDMKIDFDFSMIKSNYIISSPALINPDAKWLSIRETVKVPNGWSLEYNVDNGTMIDGNWQGEVVLKNNTGEIKARFIKPVYFDSDSNRNTNHIMGSYKIESINNNTYFLYLMVPASWLLAPERVFPVTLDPVVTNNDYAQIPSCFYSSYYASNLSVAVGAGNLITNTYLLWEFTAVNNGAWIEDQRSYVTGVNGSTSVYYGTGATSGTFQYSLNSTIGNSTATGTAMYTFYASRVWGGSACDVVYNYLNRRYIEVTYGTWGCNNFQNYLSGNGGFSGYAQCNTYSSVTIGPGQYINHYAYLGSSYTINTCGTYNLPSFDSQLTAFQGGSAVIYYNDDGGSACTNNGFTTGSGLDSWVDWPSSLNGWVQIQVTKYTYGGCLPWYSGATSAILRIKENLPATPTTPVLVPPGGTYCAGANVYLDAVGTPPTGVTWYWQTSPAGTSTANGGPTYPLTNNGTYYLRPRTSSGCWGTATAGVAVIFYPGVANNSISANQTICSGSIPSPLIGSTPTGGGTGFTYGWQYSIDGGLTWNNCPAPNQNINYSPPALTTTTYYRRWVTSDPCPASVSDNNVIITVQPQISPGTISASQSVCYNTAPATLSGSSPSGGNGSFAYQWESTTVSGCGSGWSNISGATAYSYAPPALTTTTCYRRRVSSGVCADAYSNNLTITVYPDLNPGSVGSNQSICYNTTPAAFTQTGSFSGGTGSYNLQW